MEKILSLVHVEADGSLPRAGLETLGAARSLAVALGASFDVGLIGETVEAAADSVAGCGAAAFWAVSGPAFAQARYSTDVAAAAALAKAAGATLVLAPQTSRFSRIVSGLAFRLGGRADTHVTAVAVQDGAPQVSRWFYRQRMEGTLQRTARPWVIGIDPGSQAPAPAAPGKATLKAVSVAPPAPRTEVAGLRVPPADQQTIRPDAELLFVAGAGWTKPQADGKSRVPDAEQLILTFLDRTKASLGGSKSLVDISGEGQAVLRFMTHLNQIGQTGATPRHPKGLATCCHGEEPHTVGWRFVNERRAINKDASCGWARGKADVLYVADAFEVMAKVNELLT